MPTLHLVSHTHWDREWYLTFQQFRIKLVHLIDRLLDILDTDPLYHHFMLDGQTVVLEDYLEIRPERENDLLKYIQNGRILIGPWFILPDEFLVSPESTIRNLLEGERICSRFGKKMKVGYIPDPFGHISQMPQILTGFGLDSACVMRGLADEPVEFIWKSPDGSSVLMANLRGGYGNAAGILSGNKDRFVSEASRLSDELRSCSASSHLLLMHGVDHMEPQTGTSEAIRYANQKLQSDTILHSTLPNYIDQVKATVKISSLPVVTGELRSPKKFPLLPAVLSTRMWIKQRNQASEILLEKWAEPATAWLRWMMDRELPETLLKQPEAMLRHAWRLLMLCHPHDSICGCSIDQVHEEMKPRFDQVDQIGEEIVSQALSTLAEVIDTRTIQESVVSSIVVFNPFLCSRTDLVEALLIGLPERASFQIIDEKGCLVAYQSKGMSSSDFINMVMTRNEFQEGMGMVADGIVMGLRITGFTTHLDGNIVTINLVLSQKGEPNMSAWEQGKKEIGQFLEDTSITKYHVIAKASGSAQVNFLAQDIPGLGYRTYWVIAELEKNTKPIEISPMMRFFLPVVRRLSESSIMKGIASQLNSKLPTKKPQRIENEFFVIESNKDGTVDIYDKRNGARYSGLNRFEDGGDRGDEYNYSPPPSDGIISGQVREVRHVRNKIQSMIEIHLDIEVPASLAVNRKARSANTVTLPVISQVILTSGVPRVDFKTEVKNLAKDHRLRVLFPMPFSVEAGEYDGHFDLVSRPIQLPESDESWVEMPRPEVPQRAFTHVFHREVGLVLANRGLPEVEVRNKPNGNSEIALTLLRCVGWLSRDDFPERKGHAGPFMETPAAQMIGNWNFNYSIIPYIDGAGLGAIHQAYAFQGSLRSVSTLIHDGKIPGKGSFVQTSHPEFIVSAVKTSEDGTGWIVRGYNLTNKEIEVGLTTILPVREAIRVNLAEVPVEILDLQDGCKTKFPVKGKEVVTVMFR